MSQVISMTKQRHVLKHEIYNSFAAQMIEYPSVAVVIHTFPTAKRATQMACRIRTRKFKVLNKWGTFSAWVVQEGDVWVVRAQFLAPPGG